MNNRRQLNTHTLKKTFKIIIELPKKEKSNLKCALKSTVNKVKNLFIPTNVLMNTNENDQ